MTFAITYVVVFTAMLVSGVLTARKFFLTSSYAGYVFMAINWAILALAALVVVYLLEHAVKMIAG